MIDNLAKTIDSRFVSQNDKSTAKIVGLATLVSTFHLKQFPPPPPSCKGAHFHNRTIVVEIRKFVM